jgi:hypothetical protein
MDGWFEIEMGCYCWHGVFLCFSIHKASHQLPTIILSTLAPSLKPTIKA